MKVNDIVNQLRKLAAECEDESVQLPLEMVNVIDHGYPDEEWSYVSVQKVLQYISDMLEK
jgi:hypothetical protein